MSITAEDLYKIALERAKQAEAEVARLRMVLAQIQDWDCLNPPDPRLCADHPWLRRLVDNALAQPSDSAGDMKDVRLREGSPRKEPSDLAGQPEKSAVAGRDDLRSAPSLPAQSTILGT